MELKGFFQELKFRYILAKVGRVAKETYNMYFVVLLLSLSSSRLDEVTQNRHRKEKEHYQ